MNKFQEGDRVICLTEHDGKKVIKNMLGTIGIHRSGTAYLVEFDCDIGGHNGNRASKQYKQGHCWFVTPHKLKLYTENKILAKLLEVIQ